MTDNPTLSSGRALALYLPLFLLLGTVALFFAAPTGDEVPSEAQLRTSYLAGAVLALPLTGLLYARFVRVGTRIGLFSHARWPTLLRCSSALVGCACIGAHMLSNGDLSFAAIWLGLAARPLYRLSHLPTA